MSTSESTSEGKCVLVEVGALISWCIYSHRIVMLSVPYMWASMTFLPTNGTNKRTVRYSPRSQGNLVFMYHVLMQSAM